MQKAEQLMSSRSNQIHSRLTPVTPAEDSLPYWTRSTNPIVRRHLGLYWRTLPPELRPVLYIALGWIGVFILNLLIPNIANYTLVTVMVSLVVMPLTVLGYAHILLTIAIGAADMMQEERRNNTLNLLRTTPMTLEQILLGKVAASLWRRMDDWILVNYSVALTAPPIFYAAYSSIWLIDPLPLLFPTALTGLIAVSLLRLILEPLMVGVIGVFVGVITPQRNVAITLSVVMSVAYFGLLWLVGQFPFVHGITNRREFVPPSHGLVLLIDYVLPLVLPMLIMWGLLRLTTALITRDEG